MRSSSDEATRIRRDNRSSGARATRDTGLAARPRRRGDRMRRRAFIGTIGAMVLSSPLMARAQQSERMRRVGVLTNRDESNPEGQAHLRAFVQRLGELGWVEGRNLRLDIRWGAGSDERY